MAHVIFAFLAVIVFAFSSLTFYLLFFDRDVPIIYGKNTKVSIENNYVKIDSDAVRVRACDTMIYRKISGCIQHDIPVSIAVMPLGRKIPEYMLDIDVFADHIDGKLENKCFYAARVYSYCNVMQRVFRLPIIQEVGPIEFNINKELIGLKGHGSK